MRDALPGITYVPAGSSADDQIIRNADAVWLRTDYMSHTAYTPAIAAWSAKKSHGKAVRRPRIPKLWPRIEVAFHRVDFRAGERDGVAKRLCPGKLLPAMPTA